MDFKVQHIQVPTDMLINTINQLYGSSEGDPTSILIMEQIGASIRDGEAFAFIAEIDDTEKMYIQCAPKNEDIWIMEVRKHSFNLN